MIALLTGVIAALGPDFAVIDVHGVGYQVFCSRRTLDGLGAAGSPARLHIETQVREDHIHLYGFAATTERDLFRLLQTVQGVGSRVALALLGLGTPAELALAIGSGDRGFLARAEGVGPRLSQRIAAELRDRATPLAGPAAAAFAGAGDSPSAGAVGDAVSALVNLGYGRAEAHGAVLKAARRLGEEAKVEALIPAALKELSA